MSGQETAKLLWSRQNGDSYAHATLLTIGKGLGWDASQLQAIAQDGLKRNPQDITLYFDMMTTLLPKWGGDARTLDKYIRQVAEQARAVYGTGMYARLYSAAAEQEHGHALFENSYVDWATMKPGYEAMQFGSDVGHSRYGHPQTQGKNDFTVRSNRSCSNGRASTR